MKPWTSFIAIAALFSAGACLSQPPFQDPFTRPQIDWKPDLVLHVDKAQRILGSQGHLEKVTSYLDKGTKAYQSAFRDDSLDPETRKAGTLYYMCEEYQDADAAKSFLDSTLKANHMNSADGIRMEGGAELHYFGRGDAIRMVMILKKNRLVRLKVNPVTSRYSPVEFRKVAAELARQL
jgi:hypothetical protein